MDFGPPQPVVKAPRARVVFIDHEPRLAHRLKTEHPTKAGLQEVGADPAPSRTLRSTKELEARGSGRVFDSVRTKQALLCPSPATMRVPGRWVFGKI